MEHTVRAEPKVVTSPGVEARLAVDAAAVGDAMVGLGISPELTRATCVYTDNTNRIATNGITYPGWLGRLRHFGNPQLRRSHGPIVRISTVVRGVERSEDEINGTLGHELEHVAQMERNDPKMKLGLAAIWGLAAVGGTVGNRLSRKHGKAVRVAATVMGAALGQQIGYQLAPHEVQARKRAATTKISAIKRR